MTLPVVTRAVVFDVGGVLCSFRDDDLDARWEKRLGLAAGFIHQHVWSSPLQLEAERGEVSFEVFWEHVIAVLHLDEESSTELYEDCWRLTYLDIRVEAWVRSLRPTYQVATLSNCWSDGRRECVSRYNLDDLVDYRSACGGCM